jgi:acyl-CoA synthetase (AMP-forming)/AMP-acid ligase II
MTGQSRGLSWLPPYHDMGLIGHILQPLFYGIESIIMPPVAFLQRPLRWLEAISRFRATISYAPNFAYELVLRKVRPDHLARLDLSCWASAGNGAEPVRADTLERFCATFEPCGFRREAFCPSYGLAECTLLATGHNGTTYRTVSKSALERNVAVPSDTASPDARVVVSMGKPGEGMQVVIVDPESRTALKAGGVGEVWLRGDSIADGYFQRPEETRETFAARVSDTCDGPFLRTGDLGFLQDDELHITGRLKDLIVIDGKNHYPQDVEQTVEAAVPSIRSGGVIAFSIDVDGAEHLVVAAEKPRGGLPAGESDGFAERTIRTAIAERHGLGLRALVWVAPGSLPKTGSGKPQRRACRAAYLGGTLGEVPITP